MQHPFDLTHKKILVTGASSGLGRQTAITLSQLGAELYLTGRDIDRLQETASLVEGNPEIIIADLRNKEELNDLVDRLPKLNGIVYSVGISQILPSSYVDEKALDKSIESNFKTVVLLNSRILRKKKIELGNCSIVFISSISTQYPFIGGALYVSTKAAIEGYARVVAAEYAPKKVRVNCIRPGYVKTPMTNATEELSKDIINKVEDKQPLGLGEPEDVANTIAFYISDASKWITGTNLILGGG